MDTLQFGFNLAATLMPLIFTWFTFKLLVWCLKQWIKAGEEPDIPKRVEPGLYTKGQRNE